jgi:hypothetical protein
MQPHTDIRLWLVNRTTVLAESLTSGIPFAFPFPGRVGIIKGIGHYMPLVIFKPLAEVFHQVHRRFGFDRWKREACRRPGFLSLVSYWLLLLISLLSITWPAMLWVYLGV